MHIKNHQRKYGISSYVPAMNVILIGATSKIGRAIALTLARTNGVYVLCVGAMSQRMDGIISEGKKIAFSLYGKEGENKIEHCTDVLTASEMCHNGVWLLGKSENNIKNKLCDVIPYRATVLSYAVPCPLIDWNVRTNRKLSALASLSKLFLNENNESAVKVSTVPHVHTSSCTHDHDHAHTAR